MTEIESLKQRIKELESLLEKERESHKSELERVKTELGMRSLAIANAGPQAMRSLFPG